MVTVLASGEVDRGLELQSISVYINAISGVMVTVLASGEVGRRLELWSRSVGKHSNHYITDGINIHKSRPQL
jgi:hypothetical protein